MRTEEQIAADDALTAAIERTALAYHVMDQGDVTQEYAVVVALQRIDDEGDVQHSYCQMFRDGSTSGTRTIGLLETALFDIKMGRDPS